MLAIKPVFHILKTKVLKVSEGDTNLTENIKDKVLGCLQNRYDDADIDELLIVYTYLDPSPDLRNLTCILKATVQ